MDWWMMGGMLALFAAEVMRSVGGEEKMRDILYDELMRHSSRAELPFAGGRTKLIWVVDPLWCFFISVCRWPIQ